MVIDDTNEKQLLKYCNGTFKYNNENKKKLIPNEEVGNKLKLRLDKIKPIKELKWWVRTDETKQARLVV